MTVRVNGLDSNLIKEDLQVLLEKSPIGLPEALMIPKVQSAEDIAEVWELYLDFYMWSALIKNCVMTVQEYQPKLSN